MQTENNGAGAAPSEDLSAFNGGDATAEEARQAALLDKHGDSGEPAAADAAAAASATEGGDKGGDAAADDAGEAAAVDADASAKAAEAAAAAATDAAAAAVPATPAAPAAAADPKPEPPKDFAAATKALEDQYEAGDLDDREFIKKSAELSREQALYEGRVERWEERQKQVAAEAQGAFNRVAAAWEAKHAEFMKNPLRQQAMQAALQAIDQETGGSLSPEDLFARAEKAAFEAMNYTPPEAAKAGDPEAAKAAVAKAVQARVPKTEAPPNLGRAPAATEIDGRGNDGFAKLDGLDISELEDAMARMPRDQLDAYLRASPGGATTLRESREKA